MSKRKGLSLEEKRQRMLELFYEKKDFFQLKELEKIAPKEKGIISQSVKDVVQSLVDDGLVDTDKIGTCVYFWAYPSKARHTRKRKLEDVTNKLDETRKKVTCTQENIIKAKVGREETDRRMKILQRLSQLKEQKQSLKEEIQKYKDCDPEVLENTKKQTQVAKESANRWTDNIFAIKSWCKNKFFIEENVLDKQFGIPSELDYID